MELEDRALSIRCETLLYLDFNARFFLFLKSLISRQGSGRSEQVYGRTLDTSNRLLGRVLIVL